ncbi:hypothetical protein [Microbacterium sp. MPKO10]|uniref:hypothetical protein n=1 Tax=Microbacterium sp. MPKO10 TaxID=2989818 RepID=UPI0022360127|nr:hypothetical protein [Microbacterium sp. MPKO10]MCW4457224.1 hypothetical protein [Microbacterium sp. MPKO10]
MRSRSTTRADMSAASPSFARVRRTLLARGAAREPRDVALTVYSVGLGALVAMVPIIRTLVLTLAAPGPAAVLTAPYVRALITTGCLLVLLIVTALGGVRGAVVPAPPYVQFVVGGAYPRSITLRRSMLSVHAVSVTVSVVSALIMCAAVSTAGSRITAVTVTSSVAMAVAFGAVLATAWLAGQVFRIVRTSSAVAVLLLAVAGTVTVTGGYTDAVAKIAASTASALAWPASASAVTATIVVCVVSAFVAIVASSAMLDRVRRTELMRQAVVWRAAGTLALTADMRGTVDSIRQPARHRPAHVRWATRSVALRILVRDVGGVLRHPVRTLVGAASALAAGALVPAMLGASANGAALAGAVSALLAYAAAGAWSDGLRSHADNIGAPTLFGFRAGTGILMHVVTPLLAMILLLLAGVALVTVPAAGGSPAAPPPEDASLWTAALALGVLACALRAHGAVKGPMPLRLLAPISTPAGDASILVITAWALDGPVLAIIAGLVLVMAVPGGVLPVLGATVVMLAILAPWAWLRLRDRRSR